MMILLGQPLTLLSGPAGALPERRRILQCCAQSCFAAQVLHLFVSRVGWRFLLQLCVPKSVCADLFPLVLCIGQLLGLIWVSYSELLVLCELRAGEMLVLEKAVPRSVGCSIFPVIDIWRSCRLIGGLTRALCTLPGGLGGFLPCRIGAMHCRVEAYWLGEIVVMDSLPGLVRLLWLPFTVSWLGVLPSSGVCAVRRVFSRYCATRFAGKVHARRLSPCCGVADIVTEDGEEVGIVHVAHCAWLEDLVGFGRESGLPKADVDAKRRCVHQQSDGMPAFYDRVGVG